MKIKKRIRIVYAIDLDGTLCEWKFWWWAEPAPIKQRIELINRLYIEWAIILIYTARDPEFFTDTYAWLIKHWVKHHWINMWRKPGADVYIDDKAINVEDFF